MAVPWRAEGDAAAWENPCFCWIFSQNVPRWEQRVVMTWTFIQWEAEGQGGKMLWGTPTADAGMSGGVGNGGTGMEVGVPVWSWGEPQWGAANAGSEIIN